MDNDETITASQVQLSHLITGLNEISQTFDIDNYTILYSIFGRDFSKYEELISNVFLNKKSDIILNYGNNNHVLKVFLNKILEQKRELNDCTYTTITLNGYIHTTEDYALKRICQVLNIKTERAGFDNSQKALEYFFKNQVKKKEIIVIYYDNFEHLMIKKKQILLYTLLELINSSQNILLIGFTGNYNLIDLMEKRIRSRFSQKTMFITIPGIEEAVNGIEKIIKSDLVKIKIQPSLSFFYECLISEDTPKFIWLINKYINLGNSIIDIFTKVKYIIVLIIRQLEIQQGNNEDDDDGDMMVNSPMIIEVINNVLNEVYITENQGSYFNLLKNFPKLHITILICLCHCAYTFKDKITIGMIYQKYYDHFHKASGSGTQKSKLDLTLVKKYLEELANSNLISIKSDDKYGSLYELKLPLSDMVIMIKSLSSNNKLDIEMTSFINMLKT